MYVIMVYDVQVKRVNRVLKKAREYLTWIQNSVLEGELTEAQFARLKSEVRSVIKEEKDSVAFYKLRTTQYLDKEYLGVEKNKEDSFI